MPRYKALRKFFDGKILRMPGDIIDLPNAGNPELVEPVDGGPLAPRRLNDEHPSLDLEKRSELSATRKPLS